VRRIFIVQRPNDHVHSLSFSWRPVTTFTYKLNYLFSESNTLSYHIVNILIHASNSVLMVLVALAMLDDYGQRARFVATAAGALFAAHPVHAESTSNITGRAELLGCFFYALGFVIYVWPWRRSAPAVTPATQPAPATTAVTDSTAAPPSPTPVAAPIDVDGSADESLWHWRGWLATFGALFFTLCSLLSKEHGITLPVFIVAHDFLILSRLSLRDVFSARAWRGAMSRWCVRTLVLAAGTIAMALWRHRLNGGSPPNLWHDQVGGVGFDVLYD
jgi:hypothetical protein